VQRSPSPNVAPTVTAPSTVTAISVQVFPGVAVTLSTPPVLTIANATIAAAISSDARVSGEDHREPVGA
jgi:hypothetical protein